MTKLPGWNKKAEVSQTHKQNNKNFWHESQSYIFSIWKRIANWKVYPLDYIHLHELFGLYTLYHFQNNTLIHTQQISLEDTSCREYITRHPNTPICFIVQAQDCEFRTLPTNKIKMWDRVFLLNQIKTNEFRPDDLIGHYRIKHFSERTDTFVSIRSTEEILQVFKTLASFENPISGILSWDLELSLIIKKHASITHPLRAWVVTIIPADAANFTILIFFQEKILLQRVIFTKNTDDLEKELCSTLRFLQRHGYKDGQAVSVLMPEENSTNGFSNAALEIIAIPQKILGKENFKPNKSFLNFSPKILFQARLAHEFPRLCIKFLIPLSFIFLILWASVQIKSFFQDYEYKWLKAKYEKIHNKIPEDFEYQLHLSNLFPLYLDNSKKSSFKLISSIQKLLKDKVRVSLISWDFSEQNFKLYLRFTQLTKPLHEFKKYINNNAERFFGKVILTWSEQDKDTTLLIQQRDKS